MRRGCKWWLVSFTPKEEANGSLLAALLANDAQETRDDLERDEMIFADQQRELVALRAAMLEAQGGHSNGAHAAAQNR